MGNTLDIDALKSQLGQEIGVSDWFDVTQNDVNTFADVTRDQQFIHVDPERAAQSPFGGTVAHGFYTMSLMSYFAENGCGLDLTGAKMGVNYGCDKLRFIQPVRVGSRIRGRSTLLEVSEKSAGQYLFKQQFTIEIEDSDKPALIAEWLTMAFF